MKLIVQADDFAMTDAVAEGILKAARDGILTQTGLMTNGPHASYYAKRMMEECPHVCLGQEINLVSGRPLYDPKDIPTLVNEDGTLIRSVFHRQMDKTNPHHVTYEDAFKEIEAQYLKFIEIVGHQPYFFGLHSYHNDEMMKAMEDVQNKYNITTIEDMFNRTVLKRTQFGPWYPMGRKDDLSQNPIQQFMNGECGYITDYVNDKEAITFLHTHSGYIDKELLDMSTLTFTRVLELDLLCSSEIKQWIKDHRVELVNMRDLVK